MTALNAARRNALPESDFAIPPDGYPIDTRDRAIAALGRVKENGSPAEQAQVRRAVCKRYSDLPECQSPGAQVDQQINGSKS